MAKNYPKRRKQLEEPINVSVRTPSTVASSFGEEVEVEAIQFTNSGKVLVEGMKDKRRYDKPKKSTFHLNYLESSEDRIELNKAAVFDPLHNSDQWNKMGLGEAIEDLANLKGDRAHCRALKTSEKYEGDVQVVELQYEDDSDVIVLPDGEDLDFIDFLYGKMDRSSVPLANIEEKQEKRVQRNREKFSQSSEYGATIEVGEDVHPQDVRAALGEAETYVLEEHGREWALEIANAYDNLKQEAGIR
jgi:hypothetical protein